MIDLIQIDNIITKINDTYETMFDYCIMKIEDDDFIFAKIIISNYYECSIYFEIDLFEEEEFDYLNFYNRVLKSYVEAIYEN